MRAHIGFALLLCAVLLVGCRQSPAAETEIPPPTPTAVQTPVPLSTPSPAPTPTTPEEAAILYARFLQDDITTVNDSGEVYYHSQFFSGLDMERAMDIYYLRDLTGDSIPELCGRYIWAIENNEIISIGGIVTGERMTPNGGIFYHRPGGAPEHHDYHYEWLSPESHELPEMGAQTYDMDNDGILDTFSFWANGNHIDGNEEEWNEAMAPYFALLEEEYPPCATLREWAAELGVEFPPPEMNEAKACRIFTPYVAYDWRNHNPDKNINILYVWDFDGDGIPEVYENEEPYLAYGIVGLHVEELGPATELGELPEAPPSFQAWYKQLSEEG